MRLIQIRQASVALLLCLAVQGMAQDESLTSAFAGMSAKQRTKLAKQERFEAAEDHEFQRMMSEAGDLFRERHYEDALALYKEARSRRPLNVNPKVKIEDLKALLHSQIKQVPNSVESQAMIPQKPVAAETGELMAPVIESAPALEPNTSQRIYRLGNASILERIVQINNRPVNFRRVQHNWGGLYYFRGSTPIAEHEWHGVFGED